MKDVSPMFIAILPGISCNFLFYWNIAFFEERKTGTTSTLTLFTQINCKVLQ